MDIRKNLRCNRGVVAVALAGAAFLAGGTVAQPAAAAELPWGQANFYSGADLTGTVYPIPAASSDAECINLPEPMKSIANLKYAYVDVFSGEDCTHGYARITGLHAGTLAVPAMSYKVLVAYPPVHY
ncbi:hypothetical protein [Streptomyces sp. NPDC057428]|uniref:hypothetical protein n=1 Tax=Streptomyces sp. NPDC057428 TaxID=3346129 RepID=UPI0036BF3D1F